MHTSSSEPTPRTRLLAVPLLALCALFMLAPAIAAAMGVTGGGTTLQNRALAKQPRLTFAKVWNGSFGREFSDWVWDMLPLRDQALRLNHRIDMELFRDSPTSMAFFGLDGFSWRRERVLQDIRAGGGEPKDMHKALDRIEAAFADAGVTLHIVVTPTKQSIYTEYLPDNYRAAYIKIANPMEQYLRTRTQTDPVLIDLWTPLLDEKQRLIALRDDELSRPEMRFLWRKNDDHWNIEAGRIQARAVVQHIDASLWDEQKAPILDGRFEMLESELSRLYFKLGIKEPYQGYAHSPLVKLGTKRATVGKSKNQLITMTSAETSSHTPSPLTLLVVRDSQLSSHGGKPGVTIDAGYQTIAPFFATTHFAHWETVQTARKDLAPRVANVDHVVLQVTQGNNYYLVRRAHELVELARFIKKARE